MTVLERMRAQFDALPPAERKVARRLMVDTPVAGLQTIAQLAAECGVSGPTVLRLVSRLGFEHYAAFQAALRGELEERLASTLSRSRPDGSVPVDEDFLVGFAERAQDALAGTLAQVPRADFEALALALADPAHRVVLAGGRLTQALAAYLAQHLRAMRPGVDLLAGAGSAWADTLVDFRKGDLMLLFDIRRYDPALEALARKAAQHRLTLCLITDQWLSPIAPLGRLVLVGRGSAAAGWDSKLPLFVLVEALIARVHQLRGAHSTGRLALIDEWGGA